MSASRDKKIELLDRANEMILEIEGIFADAAHWNRVNPDEEPIDVDPDGELARVLGEARRIALRLSAEADA